MASREDNWRYHDRAVMSSLACLVFAVLLHAALTKLLAPCQSHDESWSTTYLYVGRACISGLWIRLHQWMMNERRIHPITVLMISLLAPYLVSQYWKAPATKTGTRSTLSDITWTTRDDGQVQGFATIRS